MFPSAHGSVDIGAIADMQGLRNAMGLGNTLGALPVENGGTGVTSLLDLLIDLLELYQGLSFSFSGGISPWTTPTSNYVSAPSSNFSSASTGSFTVTPGNVGAIKVPFSGSYDITLTIQANASGHPATIVVVNDVATLQDDYNGSEWSSLKSSSSTIYSADIGDGAQMSINQTLTIPAGGGIAFYHMYYRAYNITMTLKLSM